jgi:DNA mismatch repair protein MutH
MMDPVPAPESEAELVRRVRELSGRSLGEVAETLGLSVPEHFRHAKGWVGQLLEKALGATASSRAAPDFELLGVEMKTIPIDERGIPQETTFVCTIPLQTVHQTDWEQSRVRKKLARVLWVPIEATRSVPVAERRIGSALLWSPSFEQEQALRGDWEQLAGLIACGDIDSITGHLGTVMQVRPKAANAKARRNVRDEDGLLMTALPRGFYLRISFTREILREHFSLPI